MTETIPNLWPKEFNVDVQTPLTILKVQAGMLSKLTRGILEGTVETESSEGRVQHRLVIIAPAYHGYRLTLVVVEHNPDLPYPAVVIAGSVNKVACSDVQIKNILTEAFQTNESKSAIDSLIAKSNEAHLVVQHSGSIAK